MKLEQQGGSLSVEPCDTCGGVGFPEVIATCSKCNEAREHIYCMKIFVHGIRDDWICETCQNENDTLSLNMNILRDPTFDAPNDLTEHEATCLTSGFQKTSRTKEHASHSLATGGSSSRESSAECVSNLDGPSSNITSVSPTFSGSPHHLFAVSVNVAIATANRMEKRTKKKHGQRSYSLSSYSLFTKEYFIKNQGKIKSFGKGNQLVKKAWEKLSDKKKEEYCNRAKVINAQAKSNNYVVPFHSRCAPNQFVETCHHVKRRKDLMERLKKIGFDRLVELCCPKMQWDVCQEFMCSFDTSTKKISIRGKTHKIGGEDVHKLMGIPYGGKEIKPNVGKENQAFKELRCVYGKLSYRIIGSWLIDNKQDSNFEFLFVMYALGTLLCPTASARVSDRLLRVMLSTRDELGECDWSSFVFNELCKSIKEYKKELRKDKVTGRENVGGCLYFLMIYCFQLFPLGKQKASDVEHALQYWDERKVHERVKLEKKIVEGILHVRSKGKKFCLESELTHPEIKRTYTRLVSGVAEELMALQLRLMTRSENVAEGSVKNEENEDSNESAEDDSDEEENEGNGSEEYKSEEEGEDEKEENEFEEEEIEYGEEIESQVEEKEDKEENESKEEDKKDTEEYESQNEDKVDDQGLGQIEVRESTRARAALGSPWVIMKGKAGKKRTIDAREALFQLCTTRCDQVKGQEYFVDLYGYHLTRAELYCLRDRSWINDRLISMVAKTLVGEQKYNSDRMTRHIISTEMMQKMVANPLEWSWEDNEKEILPEYIGYNIGDCELIFGPTLFHDHWFCYVLETETMCFHTLDSLVDHTAFLRLQKQEEDTLKGKKQREFKGKEILASRCRDCFYKILRKVKPELFDKEYEIDKQVNWAKVHVQSDKNSCGVHVISWLQRWDGTVHDDAGYTMPKFSHDDLHQLKVECLWWLVTHRNNLHSDKVLSMIAGYRQRKRKKETHG